MLWVSVIVYLQFGVVDGVDVVEPLLEFVVWVLVVRLGALVVGDDTGFTELRFMDVVQGGRYVVPAGLYSGSVFLLSLKLADEVVLDGRVVGAVSECFEYCSAMMVGEQVENRVQGEWGPSP